MKSILLQQVQFEDVGEKSERLSGHCNQLLKTGKKNPLILPHSWNKMLSILICYYLEHSLYI